jgi:hypothetical protein
MKITNQTQSQMVLKDGNIIGLVVGVLLIIGGGYYAYHIYSTAGISNIVWVSLAVLVIGLIILLTSSTITVSIDKTQNQIFFQKKRLLGTKSQTFNIQDVLRVELRKSYRMQPGTGSANGVTSMPTETLAYQSVIVLKDGSELPLENIKNSGSTSIGGAVLMGGTGKELSMSNQVANFLGVPFQEVGPGSVPTATGSGFARIN